MYIRHVKFIKIEFKKELNMDFIETIVLVKRKEIRLVNQKRLISPIPVEYVI